MINCLNKNSRIQERILTLRRFFPLALLVCVSGCGKKAELEKKDLAPAQVVKTAKAEMKPMERTVTVTGSFNARERATLSVKVPGRLEKINVDIGSIVNKGDLLAQIDANDYELRLKQAAAGLAQARARLGLPIEGIDDKIELEKTGAVLQAQAILQEAEKNRDRVKILATEKIASQAELDTIEAVYTVAASGYQNAVEETRERQALVSQRRAELNIAQKQLSDTSVKAPFDGVVQERRAGLGEFLPAGTPLLGIAAINPLRLRLEIPERESSEVRPGQPIRISVGENTNIFHAEISRVSPMLSESNRMLVVEADVPASPELRPGLFAQASIIVSPNDHALAIPESAITSFVGLEKAFVVREGKAVEKSIRTGRRNGGFVEVLSGVALGDSIILNPEKVRTGQSVTEEADAKAR